MDPFCFSADRFATSKPCGDVKNLDSAGTKCASKRAAQRPDYHSGPHSPLQHTLRATALAPHLCVTAASHQLLLKHGSEGSGGTDSDQKRL